MKDRLKLILGALFVVALSLSFAFGSGRISDHFGATGLERTYIFKFLLFIATGAVLALWMYLRNRRGRRDEKRPR